MIQLSHRSASLWSEAHFSRAELPDHRLRKRLVAVGARMAERPGWSFPRLFPNPGELKGAYRLLHHRSATPAALQAGHRERTRAEMKRTAMVVLPEDTTTFSWTGNEPIKGLGPVGKGLKGSQGFLAHTTLAVAWPASDDGEGKRPPVNCIGVAHQILHVRKGRPAGETRDNKRARLGRERESQFWERTSEALGPAPDGVVWRRVSDRESDIYEYLLSCQALGHGFVVRACQDRRLEDPKGEYLFAAARSAPALGKMELELRGRKGKPGRTARLTVQGRTVTLAPPAGAKAKLGHPPIPCRLIRVVETHPPEGGEALEWVLLTDVETWGGEALAEPTFADATEAIRQYTTRWLAEDFHLAIKSGGMKAESLQLESGQALMAAVALMSVTALRLVEFRERVRRLAEEPADQAGLTEVELTVLRAATGRKIAKVREVALAIGHLGGHLNRKGDGMPGVLSLWRGMEQLTAMVIGFQLANPRHGCG